MLHEKSVNWNYVQKIVLRRNSLELSLNVFTEFSEFNNNNICHYSKRA